MVAVSASLVAALLANLPLEAAANQVISAFSELPYDENQHLASHILAYPAGGPCSSLVEAAMPNPGNMYRHVPVAVDGDVAAALFGEVPTEGVSDVTQCPAVCLDRGVDASLVAHPIPQKYYNPAENGDHKSFADFVSSLSCGHVEFGFINYTPDTLSLFWVNSNGKEGE